MVARTSMVGRALAATAFPILFFGPLTAPAGAATFSGHIATFTETSSVPTSVTPLDGLTLLRLSNTGEFAGVLSGPAQDDVTVRAR